MAFEYRLGLDVGANSLGWSVLALKDNKPYKVENAGSRIFSDGRDPKGQTTLKAERRVARSARRNRDRFKQRQTYLIQELEKAKLFPPESDSATRDAIQKLDPLELRANALHEKLDPYHIGRALFHINQRRGFKSNRKDTSEENKSGVVSQSVRTLFKEMGIIQKSLTSEEQENLSKEEKKLIRQEEARQKKEAIVKLKDLDMTFGSTLWKKRKQKLPTRARRNVVVKNKNGKLYKLYNFYPTRELLEDEFDKICKAQQKYHPKLLTPKVIEHLREVIFFQRPLKPQEVGRCAYMYEAGELRTFRAMPSFQRYRIYQEVNNLEWVAGSGQQYRLRDYPEARDAIVTLLEKPTTKNGKITFITIKKELKKLGVVEGNFKLNYETQEKLDGNLTSNAMQKEDCIGAQWHDWPIEKQDAFIELILDDKLSDIEVRDRLIEEYKISEEVATVCLEEQLKEGTANLSLKAAQLLTEKMKKEYCLQSEAVERVAKEHADFKSPFIKLTERGELLEQLPYYGELFQDGRHIIPGTKDPEDKHDDLRYYGGVSNPTVHIALNQIRNVINELIKLYGRPASIAIELGRELPAGEEGRKEIIKEQKKNQESNEEIDKALKGLGQRINRANRVKYRLWKELDEKNPAGRKCPFTGKTIGCSIFSEKFEVEHLIPFSRSLDDSFSNKVLSATQANRDKGQQTPYEAFGDSPGDYSWNDIFERSKNLPESKQWRFLENAMEKWQRDESDFLARHLNDTRYIGRLTKDYLEAICPHNKIDVVTGRLTALLRGHWGLNSILSDNNAPISDSDDDNADDDEKNKPKKNRDDHRHHAIDAIVVGMTTRSMLQKVATAANQSEELELQFLFKKKENGKSAIDPWNGFRRDVKTIIDNVIVSHRRRIKKLSRGSTSGQLHNETAYGIVKKLDDKKYTVVVCKPIEALAENKKKLESIRDEHLRQEFVEAFEQNAKEGVIALAEQKKIRGLRCLENWSIIPIKNKNGEEYKAFSGANNWGYEIYEYPEGHKKAGKWEGFPIPAYYANQKDFQPGVTFRPYPTAKLIMRLHINDCVEVTKDGIPQIMRLQKISDSLYFIPPNEANVDKRVQNKELKFYTKTGGALLKLDARKVHISPTGLKNYESDRT